MLYCTVKGIININMLQQSDNKIDYPVTVLFLCTANSCRSILAEGILKHYGQEKFISYSAGSMASGFVHPLSIKTLADHHIESSHLTSKSWSEFFYKSVDIVITVCSEAEKNCPIFPGTHITVNWSVQDPVKLSHRDEPLQGFKAIYDILYKRITKLIALPIKQLSTKETKRQLQQIATLL